MKNYFVTYLILFVVPCLSAQTDLIGPRISTQKLEEARLRYIEKQKEKNIKQIALDVQTILVDLIPSIVKNNRSLRFQWDRFSNKSIYIYKHLIHYDSVNLTSQINIRRGIIDTTFSLVKVFKSNTEFHDVEYTNLTCLDSFKYNFIFVDDPIKADFLFSTFKGNFQNPKKLVYVWSLPNLTESTIYHLEAEMPWDIDCYKSKILSEILYYLNIKLDDLEQLQKTRNSRYRN